MQTSERRSPKMAFIFPNHSCGIGVTAETWQEAWGFEFSAGGLESFGLLSLSTVWRQSSCRVRGGPFGDVSNPSRPDPVTTQSSSSDSRSGHKGLKVGLNPTLIHECSQHMSSKRQRLPKCLPSDRPIECCVSARGAS